VVLANSKVEIDLAAYVDHTLLNSLASEDAIAQLCEEADRFHFPSICIYPTHVKRAAEILHQSSVQVGTVIGFPSGATTTATKLYEAQDALENGATELDVVINLGWLKQNNVDAVYRELAEICALGDHTVKSILEMTLLSPDEKRLAAEIAMDAGVDFLKTSTGWQGGATVEDVQLLKEIARDRVGIKASGGIRTVEQAYTLILAGATRLGTSHGLALIRAQRTPSPTSDIA
jgi:deoxyribose-phosphate aldolase